MWPRTFVFQLSLYPKSPADTIVWTLKTRASLMHKIHSKNRKPNRRCTQINVSVRIGKVAEIFAVLDVSGHNQHVDAVRQASKRFAKEWNKSISKRKMMMKKTNRSKAVELVGRTNVSRWAVGCEDAEIDAVDTKWKKRRGNGEAGRRFAGETANGRMGKIVVDMKSGRS